jgi:hypothetical protein
VTAAAVAVNVPVVDPAATVTEPGTVRAEVRLLERVTLVPPAGAALDSATVQFVVPDALRVVLAHWSEVRVTTGLTVRVTVLLTPLEVAVTTGV